MPSWGLCDEFSLVSSAGFLEVATQHFSVLGRRRPSCYIAAAFSDGTVQCLLRDSLHQVESVELPRGGNLLTTTPLTISSLSFTATANCLLVTDSLGQLYLYRVSPIFYPGGPPNPPFTVTMLEYCLLSGRDCWDLVVASKASKLEAISHH